MIKRLFSAILISFLLAGHVSGQETLSKKKVSVSEKVFSVEKKVKDNEYEITIDGRVFARSRWVVYVDGKEISSGKAPFLLDGEKQTFLYSNPEKKKIKVDWVIDLLKFNLPVDTIQQPNPKTMYVQFGHVKIDYGPNMPESIELVAETDQVIVHYGVIEKDVDIDPVISLSGTSPDLTITADTYKIVTGSAYHYSELYFLDGDPTTTDVLQYGSLMLLRYMAGSPWWYSPPSGNPSVDIDVDTLVQTSASGDLNGGSGDAGDYEIYVTYFPDRIVSRIESISGRDSQKCFLGIDADIRDGGSTTAYNDEVRWQDSGNSWSTVNYGGSAPSGGTWDSGSVQVQTRFDLSTTDGVMVRHQSTLSDVFSNSKTSWNDGTYDNVQMQPTVNTSDVGEATVVFWFLAGNSYFDSTADNLTDDFDNPATLNNFDTGSLKTDATGDDDTDGFNERYGWYEVNCSGGLVKFDLADDSYTRYKPAFRFHSASKVTYEVYINGSLKTSGTDYNMTSQAEESETGSDIRILQLLGDYADGITDLELRSTSARRVIFIS